MSGWSFPEFVNNFKRKLKFDTSSDKKKAATFFTLKTSAQLEQENNAREEQAKLSERNVEWHINRYFGYHMTNTRKAIEMDQLIPQAFKELFERSPVRSADINQSRCTFGIKLSDTLEIGLQVCAYPYFYPDEEIEHMMIPHDIMYTIEYHYSDKGDMDYRKTVGPKTFDELIQTEIPSWFKEHLNAEFTHS